ncbi:lipopolysaccharide biosynthesis protein [uncultured Bacteroides sp.]|uniref:lipopolysaccharide biosynthesis protein n=1 Tax=uncultured Bacteroides sp. TaxID=162156 RepID=UPI00280C255F|nr:lipopolysaccharide biosynthesis protein [uncultured Bacteroides sp.]
MSYTTENNKRIAKNTFFLYFRTLFTMAVSLYTSRVVLENLGVDDFGIYNVVGGIVMFLSFLNTSMASATQRFLNIELGKNDKVGIKRIFSNAIIIHFFIAIMVILLAESIGVWFLNNHMNIMPDRIEAANYVLQFSIATMVTTIISVPYNATIIANEKMSAFAYISIVEVTLKLILVLLLAYSPIDKLITYAILMFFVSLTVRLIYGAYCKKHFEECRKIKFKPDLKIIKQMMSFSMWTVIGALSSIGHGQGISIVMNFFFGVVVNAAYGIANQVNQVVSNFVNNFMTALNPQIVKTYSANQIQEMHTLIARGCRLGFFLVLFFVVPITIETPALLKFWLKEVPDYTTDFVRLVLLITLFNSFSSPLSAAQGATGNIRNYQIILTTLGLLHIPLAWCCFAKGLNPNYAMYVYLIIVILEQSFRIVFVSRSISMDVLPFVRDLLFRCGTVCCLSFVIPIILHLYLSEGIIMSLSVCVIGALSVLLFVFIIGIDKNERQGLIKTIKVKINKTGKIN